MKLADWFRAKKQQWFGPRTEEEEPPAEVVRLDADLSEIEPPETRFTEEYREFLKQQEAASSEGPNKRELK